VFLAPCCPGRKLGVVVRAALRSCSPEMLFLTWSLFSPGAPEILLLRRSNWGKPRLGQRGASEEEESLNAGNRETGEEDSYFSHS